MRKSRSLRFWSVQRIFIKKAEISTILVAGSSGAFFHIADTIIQMDNYVPKDITASVKKLCCQYPLPSVSVTDFQLPHSHRIMSRPAESSKRLRHNSRGNHSDSDATRPERLKTRISGTDSFSLGKQKIDLRYNRTAYRHRTDRCLRACLKNILNCLF